MQSNDNAGPLAHLKILDLSRVLAGPWAGQLLGDYGADVIKVERPGSGDDTRTWGPPYVKQADGTDGPDAAYYFWRTHQAPTCRRKRRAGRSRRWTGAAGVKDLRPVRVRTPEVVVRRHAQRHTG